MLKNLLCGILFVMVMPMNAIILGPHLLNNSPSDYLLDIDKLLQETDATIQIGNVLYERDYLSTVTTYDTVIGGAQSRPTEPGIGYTFNDGQWMWIPDNLYALTGTWYWILRSESYYASLFHSLVPTFRAKRLPETSA